MISVIVTVHNIEKYVEQCVRSIINQNFSEKYEILIIDDGSTDQSGSICDMLREEDDKIRVIHTKLGGYRKHGSLAYRMQKGI